MTEQEQKDIDADAYGDDRGAFGISGRSCAVIKIRKVPLTDNGRLTPLDGVV